VHTLYHSYAMPCQVQSFYLFNIEELAIFVAEPNHLQTPSILFGHEGSLRYMCSFTYIYWSTLTFPSNAGLLPHTWHTTISPPASRRSLNTQHIHTSQCGTLDHPIIPKSLPLFSKEENAKLFSFGSSTSFVGPQHQCFHLFNFFFLNLMYWFTFFINNLIDWNFHIFNVCSLTPKRKMMILFTMWNLLLEMCNLLLPKNLGTKR